MSSKGIKHKQIDNAYGIPPGDYPFYLILGNKRTVSQRAGYRLRRFSFGLAIVTIGLMALIALIGL